MNSQYSSLVKNVESYNVANPHLRVSGSGDGVHMDSIIKFSVKTMFQSMGLFVGDSSPSVTTLVNLSLMMKIEVVELDIL